ncbi:MAG: M28 family peptidase, partial [Bacteroidota bacterium]|nr:M28 family peptidase [Bacteroidota bacterium]
INPYKGIDVTGKIMVVLGGYPQGVSFQDFSGKRGVDFDTPTNYAEKHGAMAILYIPSIMMMTQWDKNKIRFVEDGGLKVVKFIPHDRQVPYIYLSGDAIASLFQREKIGVLTMNVRSSADSVAPFLFSLTKKVSVNISVTNDTETTQNIVASLKGSDAAVKDEFVAFGAHYDHLGTGTPVNGDSIYNGADDDGSGTAALLSIAETFAHGSRPKRSLLFVWHCAEEKGLWGSRYFTDNPTIPLNKIVTQLNIDMIGRSKPDTGAASHDEMLTGRHEVFVIGSKMMSTDLGKLNEDINASFLKLSLNYKFDDPKDPLRLFFRSDHYNYAKHEIPIIFYFDGLHEDYHKVSDEVGKIDFEKYLNVTKTIFATGWTLANLPKRPAVDKKVEPIFEN